MKLLAQRHPSPATSKLPSRPGARSQRLSASQRPSRGRRLLLLLLLSGRPIPSFQPRSAPAAAAPSPSSPRSLLGRAPSPHPLFLPPSLPSFPRARPPAPGLPPGRDCLRAPLGRPAPAPCPHFLPESPAAVVCAPREPSPSLRSPAAPARGSPGAPGKAEAGERALAQPRAPALPGDEGPGR